MRKYTSIVIALFLGINVYSQTPCEGGMAGIYPCMGYDLVSHLTLSEMGISSNGNDCWGWTDPETGTEYALMGGSNRAVFIDISNATNPIVIGYLPTATEPSLWRDIKVYNNHAFIVSEAGGHGLQVFDLTRLRDVDSPPMEFDADAYLDDFGHSHNVAINEETGFAYSIGGSPFNGGPQFINIQDPLNPVTVGGYDGDGYTHDAQIFIYHGPDTEHEGKEIFLGFNENSLTIVDVTDKTEPIQLSRTEYEESAYTHQGWINEDHSIVFMNDEIDESNFGFNTRTLIMDVSDLDSPELIQEHFGTTGAIDHNLYVKGDKIFESNYQSGLRVLQINLDSEEILSEIGYFDVYPSNDSPNYDGTWSNYPWFESGNVIISAFDGFFVVRESASGISEIETPKFSIYPNPTSDMLNVIMDENQKLLSYTITDITGRMVLLETGILSSVNYSVDVSSLLPGIYTLSVNENEAGRKFIVE